jgi:hypothetical protein
MERGEERALENIQAGPGDKKESPEEPILREEGTKTLGGDRAVRRIWTTPPLSDDVRGPRQT